MCTFGIRTQHSREEILFIEDEGFFEILFRQKLQFIAL